MWLSKGTSVEGHTSFGGAVTSCGCSTEVRQSREGGLNLHPWASCPPLEVTASAAAFIHSYP